MTSRRLPALVVGLVLVTGGVAVAGRDGGPDRLLGDRIVVDPH